MIDKKKNYTLKELLELFNMYNIDFKFYGNNKNGDLEIYMKTDIDKLSVFVCHNKLTKHEYLKLTEEEVKELKFKFDREVLDVDMDIIAIVLRTSDVNIPSAKYSLKSLDALTKEQDLQERENKDGLEDGISFIIVDNNTACTLYDGFYIFNKDNKGLLNNLELQYEQEEDILIKNNLKMILDYCNNLSNEKTI